ncbi:FliO/MopB family protein [Geodermatophilus marinus]|uniref:FliO/MopB family protein n=1 Tax=Geodermatophilus sp. LHW52908 TaxID=2303986 RepID=UPI000E3D9916|nr:flagellar biosynthetic protein FliO [Geodermatophilus sp. LHW52908]RFU22860.1 flagellar protein flio [Geodermatophilus sp. LHW52908]
MTWMVIRLVLSLALIGAVLWFAARLARQRGLGQGNGLIEVVARQRMGRTSSLSVVRVAGRVLVVGSTEEQVSLLAEVDGDLVEEELAERRAALARPASAGPGVLAGSVLDRGSWTAVVQQLRDRTVRR